MAKEIYLTIEEQEYLKSIVKSGTHKAREITRARVLLMLDRTGKSDHTRYKRTADYCNISRQAVYNMRDEYIETRDVESYVARKKRETPPVTPKITGDLEAKIIAIACSEPPKGYARWTTRLIASRVVELAYVDSFSHTSVERVLKKHNLSLT